MSAGVRTPMPVAIPSRRSLSAVLAGSLTFFRVEGCMEAMFKLHLIYIYMGVSENNGTPKSSILIGFSIINHPFWGTPIVGNTHIYIYTSLCLFEPLDFAALKSVTCDFFNVCQSEVMIPRKRSWSVSLRSLEASRRRSMWPCHARVNPEQFEADFIEMT